MQCVCSQRTHEAHQACLPANTAALQAMHSSSRSTPFL